MAAERIEFFSEYKSNTLRDIFIFADVAPRLKHLSQISIDQLSTFDKLFDFFE